MRRAILRYSEKQFLELMKLPSNCSVINARCTFQSGAVEFLIEHDDLREVPEGQAYPVANAEYFHHQIEGTTFKGWRQ